MKNKLPLIFLFLFISAISFGQGAAYKYKRTLTGVKDQWHKIELPEDIFSKLSQDFSDIRIHGVTKSNDTIEAPYILQAAKENISEKSVEFTLLNQSQNNKGFFFTFEIPAETTINQLHLDFRQRNFEWRLSLAGSQNLQEWFSILDDYRILSIHNDLTDFSFTNLFFPKARFRYYRLFIESRIKPELITPKLTLNDTIAGEYKHFKILSTNIKVDKNTNETIIDADLKFPVPVSHINVFVKDTIDYYRPLTIQYLADSTNTPEGWKYLYNNLQNGTLNSFEKNEFNIRITVLQKIRLIIENHDNRPLQIDSVSVNGFVYQLAGRFDKPAVYFLTYGNPSALAPDYDISRFTEKIPASMQPLLLGEEETNKIIDDTKTGPLFQNKFWLWIIMTITIITLGWFSFRMLQEKK